MTRKSGWVLGLCGMGLSVMTALVRADALNPTELSISDPATTQGLRVLAARLPEGVVLDPGWRAVDASGVLVGAELMIHPEGTILTGLLRESAETTVALYDHALADTPTHTVTLNPAGAVPAGAELLRDWAATRNRRWVYAAPGSLLLTWRRLAERAYATGEEIMDIMPRLSVPGAYSLFSGEAAIRETLQMELMEADPEAVGVAQPLSSLQGPTVASHPFAEHLAEGAPAGDLPLARLVPPDRYFFYTDRPAKLLDWLDGAARLSGELAALGQRPLLDRQLLDRYLGRLGLDREAVRRLSALTPELAVFGPDLYLAEGSHLTVLLTLPAPVEPLLNLLPGLPDGDGVLSIGEPPVHLARHGETLILSTSASEANAALALARDDGAGSLGESAEFRYMLGQLPLDDSDELLVYLSDPFIRAMVGPRMKIAQHRRQTVRTRLELLTAANLLHQLDHGAPGSLDRLLSTGLLQSHWLALPDGQRLSLDAQGQALAPGYGSLGAMTPLMDLPVDMASPAEVSGYQAYVENYNRYWSEYFDPVAIRLRVDEGLTVDTLILPLIENSIYDGVRTAVGGEPVDLSPPTATPAPITVMSLKIGEFLANEAGGLGPLGAGLGDHLHLALYDGTPIITLGSSELLGAFGGGWPAFGGGDMLWWGGLASLLTQPAAVWLALDPQRPEGWLDRTLDWIIGQFPGDSVRLSRIGEGPDRVLSVSFAGFVRFRLFLRAVEDYLVVSNFRAEHRLTGPAEPQAANAALEMVFYGIRDLAPQLSLSRLESLQASTLANRDRLLPLLWLGAADPTAAMARHQELFGTAPRHPSEGHWEWHGITGELASSAFGGRDAPRVPDPTLVIPEPVAGLAELRLNFRFVAEGVRIRLRLR